MDGRVNNSGTKGNAGGGRRTLAEELEIYRAKIKERAIEEVATMKLYNHLENIDETDKQGIKEIALPVYLKSQINKSTVEVNLPKPIEDVLQDTSLQSNKGNEEENTDLPGGDISE